MQENIILVDENDNEIGSGEKLEVHKQGKLHRAFSIFVFNSKKKLMLQKRAIGKYHCGGLWTNTCCSHPRVGENLEESTHRRLKEEMGFDCGLQKVFSFLYKSEFDNGLIENELDHVFVGKWDGTPVVSSEEVSDWKWIEVEELRTDIKENPDNYTPWFKVALERVVSYIENLG